MYIFFASTLKCRIQPVESKTGTHNGLVRSAGRRAENGAGRRWAEQGADISVAMETKRPSLAFQRNVNNCYEHFFASTNKKNPCKSAKQQNIRLGRSWQLVHPQCITGTASALRCWLSTSAPTPICLRERFSQRQIGNLEIAQAGRGGAARTAEGPGWQGGAEQDADDRFAKDTSVLQALWQIKGESCWRLLGSTNIGNRLKTDQGTKPAVDQRLIRSLPAGQEALFVFSCLPVYRCLFAFVNLFHAGQSRENTKLFQNSKTMFLQEIQTEIKWGILLKIPAIKAPSKVSFCVYPTFWWSQSKLKCLHACINRTLQCNLKIL